MPPVNIDANTIKVRQYGESGPWVILLHGGPAAPGYMKPIGLAMENNFRVLEPFQRGSDDQPLTVARHVQDLYDVIETYCHDERPILVGHSWGAMLALAFAAEHTERAKAIVLIGCGTFDTQARRLMDTIRQERMTEKQRKRMEQLPVKYPNPDVRLAIMGGMYQQIDSVDLMEVKNHLHKCNAKAHQQTWEDMIRLQDEGVYPQTFAAIRCPVLMLHGADDPHPGKMIRDCLITYLPHMEYHQWERCGHYPWLEKAVHENFYNYLMNWLKTKTE